MLHAGHNFIVCGAIVSTAECLRSPGGKVSKGTADRSFSSVCSRNEVDRDGKPTDGRTDGSRRIARNLRPGTGSARQCHEESRGRHKT